MKIALVSDIHGNAVALSQVARRIEEEKVDGIAFLGDYVCDFPHPGRVMELLYGLRDRYPTWFLRGNREDYLIGHKNGESDWWTSGTAGGSLLYTYQNLSPADIAFFESLPFARTIAIEGHKPFTVCHASPFRSREAMLRDDARIRECLDAVSADRLFCGHAHEIRAFRHGSKEAHFVGSVGIPCLYAGMAQFAVIDDAAGDWGIRHIMIPYDAERAIAEFQTSGLSGMGGQWNKAVIHSLRTGSNAPDALARRATAIAREEGHGAQPIPEDCYLRAAREIGLSPSG